MHRYTDKKFFEKHQKWIVKLFNTKLGRWFFNLEHSSVGDKKIIKVLPNAIQWINDDGTKSTEFRTNNRFAYRMNTLLKWMPFINWSDNWIPQLAFGLTVSTFYPDADPESTSVDGFVLYSNASGVAWATIHDAASGTTADTNDDVVTQISTDSNTNLWDIFRRGFYLFDTSAIPDSDPINSATLSLYANTIIDDFSSNLDLVTSSPASNTDIVTADYDQVGTTLQATSLALSGMSTGQYNDFTLNATGLGNISKTGITKFGTRISQDTSDTEPTWSADLNGFVSVSGAEQTGTSQDPKLVVNHGVSFIPKIIMS